MKRYYAHGDVTEDGACYCAPCDGFTSIDHVVTEHPARDVRALLRAIAWHYKHREGNGWYRPRDAWNVLIP